MARPDPSLRYLTPAVAGYEPGTAGTWCCKSIPRIAGGGADLEYATMFPTEQVYDRAEDGKTRLFAGRARALR